MKKTTIFTLLASLLLFSTFGCDGCSKRDTHSGDSNNDGSTPGEETENDPKPDDKNKKQIGQPCSNGDECLTGKCSNGVCASSSSSSCANPNPCGHCNDSACLSIGAGEDKPIDLTSDPDNLQDSKDVVVKDDEDGRPAVTVAISSEQSNYIWVANTTKGLISKINTKTYDEDAVYFTGPKGTANDPSRTSINSFGDAYVANRKGLSVTKIAGSTSDCIDRNNNNTIDTSTGRDDIKPWPSTEEIGEDECILWNTPIDGNLVRGLAAQDYDPVTGKLDPVVWAGSYSALKLYKLDGKTGQIRFSVDVPVTIYGIALDSSGNLWFSSLHNYFVRIDSKRCTSEATCTNDGVEGCNDGSEDACVIQKIPIPKTSDYTYGITVDPKQRVWLGGTRVFRYDPSKPKDQRFTYAGLATRVAGVQADDKGFIWAGDNGSGKMSRINAEDPSQFVTIDGTTSRGVAVDLDGNVWGIPNSNAQGLTVVTPGPDINQNNVSSGIVSAISNAYTYSDMTGSQLRFVGESRGFYSRKFPGCDLNTTGGTKWLKLVWDVKTPSPSSIKISIRGAASQTDLASATWYEVGSIPPLSSPFDISDFLNTNGIADSNIIEVRAELVTGRLDDAHRTIVAPKLYSIKTIAECKPKPLG